MEEDKSNIKDADLISLSDFFLILYSYKKLIFITILIFAVMSVIYSISLPNKYTSSTSLKVMLNQDSQNSNRMGGISSLIGMNFRNGNSESEIIKSMILSNAFAKNLIIHDGIKEKIVAAKRYDIKSEEIIFDTSQFDPTKRQWIREVNYPYKQIPSYLEVYETYSQNLKVNINESSGLIEISFTHISPRFSKYFVDLVVQEANKVLKTKDSTESNRAIAYLNQELSKASKLEVRKAIGSLVETQLKKEMLLNISDEYALSTVNASYVPEIKSSPNRAFICILGTFIGVFLSLIVMMLHQFFIKNVQKR